MQASTKTRAEERVKEIEGVSQVINNIEVLPASSSDDHVRQRVCRAIYREPRMLKYALQSVPPIHIIVKNGHVSLGGQWKVKRTRTWPGRRPCAWSAGCFSPTTYTSRSSAARAVLRACISGGRTCETLSMWDWCS